MTIAPPKESYVDVLVIGAGPAGVMCANGLARYGIDVRIIDNKDKAVAKGQADGIQPRTIEVMQSYGLADRLLREANHIYLAAFYNADAHGNLTRTRKQPVIGVPARYPHKVTLHQGAIESIFLDSMASYGIHVERSTAPASIEIVSKSSSSNDYAVKVELQRSRENGEVEIETVHAKYVVGCDGAHSWTRKAVEIPLEGDKLNFVWGVCDTVPETDFPDIRAQCAIHGARSSVMLVPRENDSVRFYVQLPSQYATREGRVDRSQFSVQDALKAAKAAMYPYKVEWPNEIEWFTVYEVGQRVATSFQRDNRVFIAGDACHTHSPMAGQGMNTSMNDTHNLSWKLAHVLRGWADPSILSTYQFERRRNAQDLIDFDRQYSTLYSGALFRQTSEEHGSASVPEEFFKAFKLFAGFTSGIGIQYHPSTLTNTDNQSLAQNLAIGKRMPSHFVIRATDGQPFELQDMLISDAKWKILIFAGDMRADIKDEALSVAEEERRKRRDSVVECFPKMYAVLKGFVGKQVQEAFDFTQISANHGDVTLGYEMLPPLNGVAAKRHFIDLQEINGTRGGDAYKTFGIRAEAPVVVVVRPDGYVGAVAPISAEGADHLQAYLSGFFNRA